MDEVWRRYAGAFTSFLAKLDNSWASWPPSFQQSGINPGRRLLVSEELFILEFAIRVHQLNFFVDDPTPRASECQVRASRGCGVFCLFEGNSIFSWCALIYLGSSKAVWACTRTDICQPERWSKYTERGRVLGDMGRCECEHQSGSVFSSHLPKLQCSLIFDGGEIPSSEWHQPLRTFQSFHVQFNLKGGLGSTIVNLSVPGEMADITYRYINRYIELAEQHTNLQGNTASKGGKKRPTSIFLLVG